MNVDVDLDQDQLVMGLAAVFAGVTVLLVVLTFVSRQLLLVFVALPFAATAYFMWFHASGRLKERMRSGTLGGTTRGTARGRRAGATARQGGPTGRRRTRRTGGDDATQPNPTNGLSRAEAYRTLGVDPGADAETVRRAYRAKVKEVHPDTDGGDEETFKRVSRAYERLSE